MVIKTNVYNPGQEDWKKLFAALVLGMPNQQAWITQECMEDILDGTYIVVNELSIDTRNLSFRVVKKK